MTQEHFWESFTKTAADFGRVITDTAAQTTQVVAEAATSVGGTVTSAAFQAGAVVGQTVMTVGSAANNAIKHWVCFSESDSLAFYGALFAVAAADGMIDADELSLILSSPDLNNLSRAAREEIQRYSASPPNLEDALKKLSTADEKLRFGLMFYILNVVWVDKVIHPGEEKAIELAQKELGIAKEQVKAIDEFVRKTGDFREGKLKDDEGINALKEAALKLKKVGIPIESFSTSEEGLNLDNLSMVYSDGVFWEKLGGLASQAGKTVVESALILSYALFNSNITPQEKLLITGALGYLLMPFDAVPDVVPGVGFGDDLAILGATVTRISMNINDDAKEFAKQKMKDWFGE